MAELLISVMPEQVCAALTENFRLEELYIERTRARGLVGNIYKGKVVRVLPGMQAAFVDIGEKRTAFLHVDEVREQVFSDLDEDQKAEQKESVRCGIEEMLKEGEEIVVQVIKEPRGDKGSRLTCHPTLPGRYVVLLPTVEKIGISRRIESPEERDRLRELLNSIKPSGMGLIARTAAAGRPKDAIEMELKHLVQIWEGIDNRVKRATAPAKLFEEPPLYIRAIRDLFSTNIKRIIIDDRHAYHRIRETYERTTPELGDILELHTSEQPLFTIYGIDKEIEDALKTTVWLKSGGYIVIQPTEAMVVIDVNSGSYVGKDSPEQMATSINIEAAKAIVRELKKRNLSGIVIIDFIDVDDPALRQRFCEVLSEELKKDRSRVSLPTGTSGLGIVEFTRERRYPSLVETLCTRCEVCEGKGYIKSPETVACEMLAKLDRVAKSTSERTIKVAAHPTVVEFIERNMSESIARRERAWNKRLVLEAAVDLHPERFKIVLR